MTVPAATALLLTEMTWQPAVMLLGVARLVCAATRSSQLTLRYGPESSTVAATTGIDDAQITTPRRERHRVSITPITMA